MRTKKQFAIGLTLVILAVMLKITIGFTPVVDNLILLFFVLIGCWFYYENAKKKDKNK
ncbi:hypothetical protein [Carnobacterium sp.]|uniref:hypothetical protein n=1 Tax=Carnobacterium sp. TaxID=48221 RepID=UPI0038901F95